ncbi:MAG TPA: NHL repeat-containing protein [Tepidisphaeraceae bacterium]|nr:NHL repeat-containing protein [Tepidisphaeraceae bacterium]
MNRACDLFAILLALSAIAAQPMPADKCIPAHVDRTIGGQLIMPSDVTVDALGYVYVSDGVNDRIARFAPSGKLDGFLTGPADSPLSRPLAAKMDSNGALWIADTGNNRLLVHLPDHLGYQIIPLPAAAPDKPAVPTGLAIRSDGSRTYVVDNGNHRILIRDNSTGRWTAMGQWGISIGQFRWPFMICLTPDNYATVTESVGARIQQISPDNLWAGQISRFGVALGDLYRPKGVVADSAGRIFVSDSTLGVVEVFGSRGDLLGVLTDNSNLPLRFAHPMGMCFDGGGLLYVVELTANRVAVVHLSKPSP